MYFSKGWIITYKREMGMDGTVALGPLNDRQFNRLQIFKTKKAALNECRTSKGQVVLPCNISFSYPK